MKFILFGGGDSSVGIPATEMTITFEGNTIWDDDLIEITKRLLLEWDDNNARCLTEEEYNKEIEYENEQHHKAWIQELIRICKEESIEVLEKYLGGK
jgi:hypothetical protein